MTVEGLLQELSMLDGPAVRDNKILVIWTDEDREKPLVIGDVNVLGGICDDCPQHGEVIAHVWLPLRIPDRKILNGFPIFNEVLACLPVPPLKPNSET